MILVPRGEYGPPALEEIHKIRKPILQCRTVVVIVNYPVVVVKNIFLNIDRIKKLQLEGQ